MGKKNIRDFVQTLRNVKLVIGNGFDLHCGLHTRYRDYFIKEKDKFDYIDSLFSYYKKYGELRRGDENIIKLTVWDILFFINLNDRSLVNDIPWCNVEELILSSLMNDKDIKGNAGRGAIYLMSKIHWEAINKSLKEGFVSAYPEDRFLVEFIRYKISFNSFYLGRFYDSILIELKQFEKEFGQFIYREFHISWLEYCNQGKEFLNKPYISMAIDTIKELCNEYYLTEIDTFNYSYIPVPGVEQKLIHINGDFNAPIFGVDSIFDLSDERFIFTKTARRLDSNKTFSVSDINDSFKNVVIYGHSLNEADYNYFFPLFDKLDLFDTKKNNVLVFAYSIYDKNRAESIKKEVVGSIVKLVSAYAREKNYKDVQRFFDNLIVQNRIIIFEVPLLDKKTYGYTLNDQDWEERYKGSNY